MVNIDYNTDSGKVTCQFNGKMDTLTSTMVTETVHNYLSDLREESGKEGTLNTFIVFDLKEVTFISSYFIRLCMAVAKQVSPENFTVINSNPMIKKTFKITGLDEALHVV
jgi:anti-anti-sigma factor